MEGGDAPDRVSFEASPVSRWFFPGLFGLMLICVPTLLFSKLLPTPLGVRISQVAGLMVGAAAAWIARDGGWLSPANPNLTIQGRGAWMMRSVWFRAPLFGVLAYFTALVAVEGGALALFTAAVGRPASRTVVVVGLGGGGRSCRHFRIREVAILPSTALCVSNGDRALPVQGRTLTVFGRASAVGLNVERHELGPPAEAAE